MLPPEEGQAPEIVGCPWSLSPPLLTADEGAAEESAGEGLRGRLMRGNGNRGGGSSCVFAREMCWVLALRRRVNAERYIVRTK